MRAVQSNLPSNEAPRHMQIRITKSFLDPSLSPRPLITNELFDLPDAVAQKLIDEGHAQVWTLNQPGQNLPVSIASTPPKIRRERAVRS
jgi:hypothetical protein